MPKYTLWIMPNFNLGANIFIIIVSQYIQFCLGDYIDYKKKESQLRTIWEILEITITNSNQGNENKGKKIFSFDTPPQVGAQMSRMLNLCISV